MLETKRFLKADPDDMRERREARQQRAWNATYCNNEAWREAIDNGWSITSTITFRTGETVSFVARTRITPRPPRRSRRAAFPHRAPVP